MNYKTLLIALAGLLASASVYSAWYTLGAPSTQCDSSGDRCITYDPEPIELYSPSEINAKFVEHTQQFTQLITALESENTTLKSMVDQREDDLKVLTIKADFADKRIAMLEKKLKELLAEISTRDQKTKALLRSGKK